MRELAAKGRPGMQVVRALLDARAPGAKVPDSILETKLGRILSSLRPVWGYGWASHCGRLQWEGDIARQNALVRAGWTVLRYPLSVIVNRPHHVEREVVATRARLSAGR